MFARSMLLLRHGSFGEIFWFRLLLRSHGFNAEEENRAESQGPGTVTHSAIVARARHDTLMKV